MSMLGSRVFQGAGSSDEHHIIPDALLRDTIRNYKARHGLLGKEIPIPHVARALMQGHKYGVASGGFLPFALLLPFLGKAALALGGAAAAGAAGTAGSKAIEWIGKKISGNGYGRMSIKKPTISYDKGEKNWVVHGEGIKDIFGTLAGTVGKWVGSRAGRKITHAGKDALVNATVEALKNVGGGKNKNKNGGGKRKRQPDKPTNNRRKKKKQEDEDQDMGLDGLFNEEERAPAPPARHNPRPPVSQSRPSHSSHPPPTNSYLSALASGQGYRIRRY